MTIETNKNSIISQSKDQILNQNIVQLNQNENCEKELNTLSINKKINVGNDKCAVNQSLKNKKLS